jgi:hypothetical protein
MKLSAIDKAELEFNLVRIEEIAKALGLLVLFDPSGHHQSFSIAIEQLQNAAKSIDRLVLK